MPLFHVDVPNWIDPEGEWKHIEDFDSREAAIQFAKETFGADEEGRVRIISISEDDDDTDPDWKEVCQIEIREAIGMAFRDFSVTTKQILINDTWCNSYNDLVANLVALSDEIHDVSQTPEEFNSNEAMEWAEAALQDFDQQLEKLGWFADEHER